MRRIVAAAVLGVVFSAGAVVGPIVERITTVRAQQPGGSTVTQTFPNRRYNQGTDTIGPVSIPVGATALKVRATRDAWPDIGGEVFSVLMQISFDGGNTWMDWGGFGAYGGDVHGRDGSIVPESYCNVGLPDSQNPQRQLRGTVTVNRALNTAITVEIQ